MRRAESFPIKSINQYRTRDVFAYLALRYCSNSEAARSNSWVEFNATQIVKGSKSGTYLRSHHFKQMDKDGSIEHRDLFIPGASEALAEAALLADCAEHLDESIYENVFSYRLTGKGDRKSYFEPYMTGLRQRQTQIAAACSKTPDALVAYIDIQRFYPSITTKLAAAGWLEFSTKVNLRESMVDLGLKLINNYDIRGNGYILTGPMFSHFLANLVLTPIDQFGTQLPVHYFRYVDDMTLVGTRSDIESSIDKLATRLSSIGLSIHHRESSKTMIVPATEWLDSANDFSQTDHSLAWMRLVGDIKKLILFNKHVAAEIEDSLLSKGFRLPIPDYALAIDEASSFEKIRQLGLWNWLQLRTQRVNIETITSNATELSNRITVETIHMLGNSYKDNSFQRKRLVSKLRYRLGRLIYLGLENDLTNIANEARNWPELKFHVAIIDAIVSGDCFEVVSMGTNVAQATAQAFRPTLKTARFSRPLTTEAQIQGLAILILNGVPVEGEVRALDHPILRFARGPIDSDLMTQPRGLLQELSCLHGAGEIRHPAILESAFDIDENIVLDGLELDYGYSL